MARLQFFHGEFEATKQENDHGRCFVSVEAKKKVRRVFRGLGHAMQSCGWCLSGWHCFRIEVIAGEA
jgi:hypothetical protein